MLKLVVASCLALAAAGQFVDPKNAKILKEQRFNAGDGRFGSAYAQEDGVVFREETGAEGERVGQYSYIGDDGKTYTVKYTAGKDGFRILDGTHVPTGANGLNSAPFAAEQTAAVQVSAPVRSAPVVQQQAAAAPKDYDYVDEVNAPVDPNFNPFINPHDPTHRNLQFNSNAARFAPQQQQPQQQQQQQFNSAAVPNCADCAGVNPFVNPFDASHQQGGFFAGQQAGQQQQQQQRFVQPQQPAALPAFLAAASTEAPRRFFPPGQLQLNRFETGFNFDFASQ